MKRLFSALLAVLVAAVSATLFMRMSRAGSKRLAYCRVFTANGN